MAKEEEYYEEVEYDTYYIPVNVEDDGNILNGRIKLRNFLEMIVVTGIVIGIWYVCTRALPFIAQFVSFLIVVIPVAIITLVGVKGGSFLEFVIAVIWFKKKRRIVRIKLPHVEEVEMQQKTLQEKAAPEKQQKKNKTGRNKQGFS